MRPAGWWSRCSVSVLLAVVFLVLLAGVISHGPLDAVDHSIRAWVRTHQQARLLALSTAITDVGNPVTAVPALFAVALGLSAWRRSWLPLAVATGATLALAASVLTIKWLVARPAPRTLVTGRVHLGGAFPSGHTTTAVVCYGTIALLLTVLGRRPSRRWPGRAATRLAALVGGCLVYSDFHWLSDVLAGLALGGLLLWLGMAVVATRTRRSAMRNEAYSPRTLVRPGSILPVGAAATRARGQWWRATLRLDRPRSHRSCARSMVSGNH